MNIAVGSIILVKSVILKWYKAKNIKKIITMSVNFNRTKFNLRENYGKIDKLISNDRFMKLNDMH